MRQYRAIFTGPAEGAGAGPASQVASQVILAEQLTVMHQTGDQRGE
jgi:hypothetical protein